MRLNPRAVLSLLADDDVYVIELCEASLQLCVLHCEVKVESKVFRRVSKVVSLIVDEYLLM